MKKQIKGLVNLISDTDLLMLGEKERFTKNAFNNPNIVNYIIYDLNINIDNIYFIDIFNAVWEKIYTLQEKLRVELKLN